MNAAVFLDRDNTIIHNDGDLGDPKLLRLIQGAASAIASMRGLGYKIIVVTNQGGVARGKFTEADVEATNQKLNEMIVANSGATVDRFYFCPYHPQAVVEQYRAEHPWRKPQPGMLLQAARDFNLDLAQCWMIGDQVRDIQAGIAASTRPILIRTESAPSPDELKVTEPYFVAGSLVEAVKIVAQKRRPIIAAESFVEGPSGRIRAPLLAPGAVSPRQPATYSPAMTQTQPPVRIAPPTAVDAPAAPVAPAPTAPQPAPILLNASDDQMDEAPFSSPLETPPSRHAPPAPEHKHSSIVATLPTVDETVEETIAEKIVPVEHAHAAPAHSAPRASTPTDAMLDDQKLMLQILHELRNQRQIGQDFSLWHILAIVLQMVVIVCLLAALWFGTKDVSIFLRFISVGILLQLMAIALPLLRR